MHFDGVDLTRARSEQRVRAGMGYVPQGHEAFPQLTVWENLLVVQEASSRGTRAQIDGGARPFPPSAAVAEAPGRFPLRRPTAAAGHRPGPGNPALPPAPRRADRRYPALDHPRDRGRDRRPPPAGRALDPPGRAIPGLRPAPRRFLPRARRRARSSARARHRNSPTRRSSACCRSEPVFPTTTKERPALGSRPSSRSLVLVLPLSCHWAKDAPSREVKHCALENVWAWTVTWPLVWMSSRPLVALHRSTGT